MPSVPPPGSHQQRFTTIDRAPRVRFRRALMLMVMTLVVPGSAQLVAGNRRVGRIALRIWFAAARRGRARGRARVLVWHEYVFWLVSRHRCCCRSCGSR